MCRAWTGGDGDKHSGGEERSGQAEGVVEKARKVGGCRLQSLYTPGWGGVTWLEGNEETLKILKHRWQQVRWQDSVRTLRDHLPTTCGTNCGEERMNERSSKIFMIGWVGINRIEFYFLYYWGLVLTASNRKLHKGLTPNMRSFLSHVKAQLGTPGMVWQLCRVLKAQAPFCSPFCHP